MDMYSYKCRACRMDTIECVDMDSPFGDTSPLTVIECFNLCTGVGASHSDELPNHICSFCNEELKVSYNFFQKVRESDEVFKKELNAVKFQHDEDSVDIEEIQQNDNLFEITIPKDEKEDEDDDDVPQERLDDDDFYWDDQVESAVGQLDDEVSTEADAPIKKEKAADTSAENDSSKVFFVYKGITIQKRGSTGNTSGDNKTPDKKSDPKPSTSTGSSLFRLNRKIPHSGRATRSKNVLYVNEVLEVPSKKKSAEPTRKRARNRDGESYTDPEFNPVQRFKPSQHDKKERAAFVKQVMEMKKADNEDKSGGEDGGGDKKFECNLCSKTFREKCHLTYHITYVHMKVRDYLCTLCPKSFPIKIRLEEHMRTHIGVRPYKCKECPKKFAKHSILKCHIASCHSNELPYLCTFCGKGFKQTGTLKAHTFIHTRVGHECSACGKHFPRAVDLKKHMVTHTGEKPYKCDICEKAFPYRQNLNHHMKNHSFDNVMCQECGVHIPSLVEWNAHSAEHKGEFACRECNLTFVNEKAFSLHIEFEHNKGEEQDAATLSKLFNAAI